MTVHPADGFADDRDRLVQPLSPEAEAIRVSSDEHRRLTRDRVDPLPEHFEEPGPHLSARAGASSSPKPPTLVDPPGAPYKNARRFVAARYNNPERKRLIHRGGSFEVWDGTCWPLKEDRALRAAIYDYFADAEYEHVDSKGVATVKPFDPTLRKVADLLDALKAEVHVPQEVTSPAWLDGGRPVSASELLSLQNGLLHIPTRELHPHTPHFYTSWSLPYSYDVDAPTPTKWLAFLDQVFDGDTDSIEALQEWFGYFLAGDTKLQKILLCLGPRRAGKGTMARVLRFLLGAQNVAGPTLSSLSTNFGLAPLIGKPVAVIADARLRADDAVIVERLLSISGEDLLTIDRKYADAWTGRLPTRFVLISNETPRLRDASGALSSRFIILSFPKSFYGNENAELTDELLTELPGILQWSLDGLETLRARGRFTQPAAGAELLAELEDLGSPISAFVRDCCTVGAGYSVSAATLFMAWTTWCKDNGRDHPGNVQTFGRDLRAAVAGLKMTRPRAGDMRYREYQGLRLRVTSDDARVTEVF